MTAIVTAGLVHHFGEVRAVDGVTLTVPRGAVYGLLGPDGAGKSTLLRLLATVSAPDAGDAAVFGVSVRDAPGAVTPRIGYMSQQFCMYPDLTVAENLEFFATLRGVPRAVRRERSAALLASMGMAEFTRRTAGRLSGGMKQKLMLTSTLMHAPELLLLDEPTTGVDPVSRREFWAILADLNASGTTVVVATPYMDEAERCTHVAFMADGRITHTGTPAELTALVGGVLLEVVADDPRAALAALAAGPGVRSAHLLGDSVRVLLAEDATVVPAEAAAAERVETILRGRGVTASAHVIEPDMEAAFAYLAEAAS